MESLPLEIQKEVIPFLEDRSRRQLRLASTKWFNLIGYNNFEIYLTKKSEWRQIVDRFAKYDKPILLALRKNIITDPNDICEHLTRLTNLTSFDMDEVDDGYELKYLITVLSNLKLVPSQCSLCCGKVWKKFPKLEKLAIDRHHDMNNDKMNYLLNTLTNLRDLTVETDYPDEYALKGFVGVPSTLTKLRLSHLPVIRWDDMDLQNFQHLKKLELDLYTGSSKEQAVSLKYLTALESLKTPLGISDVQNRSNLTALKLTGNAELFSQCFDQLQHLKKLEMWFSPNDTAEYLTNLTSLEKFVVQGFESPSYPVLGNVMSTRLTRLRLGLNGFDMSYFSRLGSLLDLTTENMFDTNIKYLERLTHLSIYMEAQDLANHPALVLLSRLTNLRKFSCVGNVSSTNLINLSLLTNLEYLDIDNFYVPYHGLKNLTRLTTLRINCELRRTPPPIREKCSKAHAEAIYMVTKMTNLRDLTILGFEFDFSADRELLRYEGLTNLTKLVLHGFPSIGYVTCLSNLQILDYNGTKQRDLHTRLPNLRKVPKNYS